MTLGLVVGMKRLRRCVCRTEALHTEVRYTLRGNGATGSVYLADPHLGPCGRPCSLAEAPKGTHPEQGVCRGLPYCKPCAKAHARRPT